MLEADLQRFYAVLRVPMAAGLHRLGTCHGRLPWPRRGVYFFLEDGEVRHDGSPRVVRVGTHAIKADSRTKLWTRLSQHRGSASGTGNHRGSIFRLHVGGALLSRNDGSLPAVKSWGSKAKPAAAEEREAEAALEKAVSAHIGQMPFVVFNIDDTPGLSSQRAVIEQNSIGLLAAAQTAGLDAASKRWLGRSCPHNAVQKSGLWNVNHVAVRYDPRFLEVLESAALGR